MATLPKDLRLTPPGQSNGLQVVFYPRIKGGTCEACGVIDVNYPGHVQYKLCPHYKGMELKCVFCKQSADHEDVVRMSDMIAHSDPYSPKNLVTLCGSYECTKKYEEKYHISR